MAISIDIGSDDDNALFSARLFVRMGNLPSAILFVEWRMRETGPGPLKDFWQWLFVGLIEAAKIPVMTAEDRAMWFRPKEERGE